MLPSEAKVTTRVVDSIFYRINDFTFNCNIYLFATYLDCDHRKNLELEKIIMHEDYVMPEHDIALLMLKEPVDLSVRITLSCRERRYI